MVNGYFNLNDNLNLNEEVTQKSRITQKTCGSWLRVQVSGLAESAEKNTD